MSEAAGTGVIGTLTAKTPIGEAVLGLVIVAVTAVLFFTAEGLYSASQSVGSRFQNLMDYTASSDDKALAIHQDLTKYPEAKPILLSENEPSGIEFAYSFWLYINPNTFGSDDVLYHVWHKGYGCVWPLMGPGVFIRGSTNAMRVVMNTFENPYTYVDVPNIPIRKWFHVVLNCKKGGLEIHINGNLTNKIRFDKTLPYLNYQDIILFSNANYTISGSTTPSLGSETLRVSGAFKGFMSEFIYTRYAMSFTEIQTLLNMGPSSKVKTQVLELPPYLADNWWANNASS